MADGADERDDQDKDPFGMPDLSDGRLPDDDASGFGDGGEAFDRPPDPPRRPAVPMPPPAPSSRQDDRDEETAARVEDSEEVDDMPSVRADEEEPEEEKEEGAGAEPDNAGTSGDDDSDGKKSRRQRRREKAGKPSKADKPDKAEKPEKPEQSRADRKAEKKALKEAAEEAKPKKPRTVAVVSGTTTVVAQLAAGRAEQADRSEHKTEAEAVSHAAKKAGKGGLVVWDGPARAAVMGGQHTTEETAEAIQINAANLAVQSADGERRVVFQHVDGFVMVPDLPADSEKLHDALRACSTSSSLVFGAGCVPSAAGEHVWVWATERRIRRTWVTDGVVNDMETVAWTEPRPSTRAEWEELGTVLGTVQDSWLASATSGSLRVGITGPALPHGEWGGALVAAARRRSGLPTTEAAPSVVGVEQVPPQMAESAAEIMLAAMALGAGREPAVVAKRVLEADLRRLRRTTLVVAVTALAVLAGMIAWSVRAGGQLADRADAAEQDAAAAQSTLDALAAQVELIEMTNAETALALLDPVPPDWPTLARFLAVTGHPVVLDRNGSVSVGITFAAPSVDAYTAARNNALSWLDCFAQAVFAPTAFAVGGNPEFQSGANPSPLTGGDGQGPTVSDTAVFGMLDLSPDRRIPEAEQLTRQPVGDEQAASAPATQFAPDYGRDCGPRPAEIVDALPSPPDDEEDEDDEGDAP